MNRIMPQENEYVSKQQQTQQQNRTLYKYGKHYRP